MSINPLNDISRVYLEQVASVDEAVKGADPEMRRAASAERRSGDKKLSPSKGKGYADQQKQSIAYMDKITKKNKNVVGLVTKEALDPVGQEDADIDNDGDTDKSDKYLHKRRKAIGKAIAKKKGMKEGFSNWRQDLAEVMNDDENNIKIKEKKVNNKIKINPKLGEAVEEIGGTLLEMVEIDEVDYIVESVYDELLDEGYEEDDIEEALEYALIEAKVTFGHDTDKPYQKKTGAGQMVKAVGRLARQKLASKVSGAKKAAKAAVVRGARKVAKGALGVARKMEGGDSRPSAAHTKTRTSSTYRGAGAGTKEKVSSGSYTPPTKKKAEKPSDPWEGSYTKSSDTPKPKAKTKKAAAPKAKTPAATAPKRKKKSKLDSLLADIRNEEVQLDELSVNKMLAYGKAAQKDRDVLNKKWDEKKASHKEKMRVLGHEEGEDRAAEKIKKKTGKYPHQMNALDKARYAVTKEETQIDEKTLTKMEMKKREEIVKSMKDKAADFEGRYPGRGKEVMYATATKMAKKMVEQMDDSTEMSASPMDDKKMDQQKKKIQMQKIRDLTVRLSAARKGVY